MNNRMIKATGTVVVLGQLALLLCCLFSLLFGGTASMLITLLYGVPVVLISMAGIWFVGRIQVLPVIYLLCAAAALPLVYLLTVPDSFSYARPMRIAGIAVGVATMGEGILTLFAVNYFPFRKKLLGAGVAGLVLLCVAGGIVALLLSLLVPSGSGVSAIPS